MSGRKFFDGSIAVRRRRFASMSERASSKSADTVTPGCGDHAISPPKRGKKTGRQTGGLSLRASA
jgi:hypothetical protein